MKKWIKELIPYIVILVVVMLIRTFVATPVVVDGDSMVPTLKDGEVMILNKLARIDRGDIVVIKSKKEGYIIKRVYGLPNDVISCTNNHIYINGEVIEDKFADITGNFKEVQLKEDEYFVLGDNRTISKDSRDIGPIKRKEILGTTSFTLFPFNRFGKVK